MTNETPRKPVAACMLEGLLTVVCDDGAVFVSADMDGDGNYEWTWVTPIPGTAEDMEIRRRE